MNNPLIKNYYNNTFKNNISVDKGDVVCVKYKLNNKPIEIIGVCVRKSGHEYNRTIKLIVDKKYTFSLFVNNPKFTLTIINKKKKVIISRKLKNSFK